MNIAIEGCLHGELDKVYEILVSVSKKTEIPIDLLIICGDFQAIRDQQDLGYMHCPPKYKQMGCFWEYFQGKKVAPFTTIFIGGNHEAVNYMRDLYFGGWVAPKIYYLGNAGSVIVQCKRTNTKIRISGLSGIYNQKDFEYNLKIERRPLYGHNRVSAYHIKQLQTYQMELFSRILQLKKQNPEVYGSDSSSSDIFISHDWPKDMALYGNLQQLYKYKHFLRDQIEKGIFGSPPCTRILKLCKPAYWFAAHMHIKYPAIFPHQNNQYTHFLALDKCLPNRSCLQLLKFSKKSQPEQPTDQLKSEGIQIRRDPVWVAVLRLTANLQFAKHCYYKVKNNELTLVNGKYMNQYLIKYGQLRGNLQKFGQEQLLCKEYLRQEKGKEYKQIDQTKQLIQKTLGKDLREYIGTILGKQQLKSQTKEFKEEDDEIELEL